MLQELRLVFAKLELSKEKAQDLQPITSMLGLHTGIQQDATEFTKLFISYLETKVSSPSPGVNCMTDMFRGKQENVTKCAHCNYESIRESPFYELSLQIKGYTSLYTSMQEYGHVETLKGLNQYFCSKCKCKRDADRFCKVSELPAFLNLQVRVEVVCFVYEVRVAYEVCV